MIKYLFFIFLFLINNKIKSQNIEKDKIEHFLISQATNGFISSSIYYNNERKQKRNNLAKSILLSNLITLSLTGAKEIIYDGLMKKGVMSGKDMFSNISGIFTNDLFFTATIIIKYKK